MQGSVSIGPVKYQQCSVVLAVQCSITIAGQCNISLQASQVPLGHISWLIKKVLNMQVGWFAGKQNKPLYKLVFSKVMKVQQLVC